MNISESSEIFEIGNTRISIIYLEINEQRLYLFRKYYLLLISYSHREGILNKISINIDFLV